MLFASFSREKEVLGRGAEDPHPVPRRSKRLPHPPTAGARRSKRLLNLPTAGVRPPQVPNAGASIYSSSIFLFLHDVL